MDFHRLAWILMATVSTTMVTACAMPTVTHPIGIRSGNTEYRVSCGKEDACRAAIARICTTGYGVTAYIYGTAAIVPPIKQPLSFDFACTPVQKVTAEESAKHQAVQIFISSECKDMFYGPDFVDIDANGKESGAERRGKPDYVAWDPLHAVPMSYKDPRTSIAIYVESDGRHLAAIDSQGQLLWVRNPWEEQHVFCPYRTPRPVVASLKTGELTGPLRSKLKSSGAILEHSFIAVAFDSGQWGMLDESTGDFFPGGQS